jgi:hypothetical protein
MNKREQGAFMVLQGMFSSGRLNVDINRREVIAERAVRFADALLQELELTELGETMTEEDL